MTELEVTAYRQRLGLSCQAQEALTPIRNTPQRKRDGGSKILVKDLYAPVLYPCHKMARVIECESVTCELAFLMEVEHNNNV